MLYCNCIPISKKYNKERIVVFMILDISDEEFKRIFSDKRFNLPLRWNNSNFADNLSELFDDYLNKINQCCVTLEKDCLSYYSRDTI